jgi:hypothetical protein
MKISTALAAIGATLFMTACGNELDSLPGLWEGTPVTLGSVSQMNSTANISMEFNTSPGNGQTGTVTLRALINMEEATVPQFDGMVESYALNVAGTAMMNGKYAIVDDDEVAITLDPTSLTVNVDPQAVKYQSNIFTEAQKPTVDSLLPAAASHLASVIRPQISREFLQYSMLDDVKIKNGDIMSCEIADRDYTFRKITTE